MPDYLLGLLTIPALAIAFAVVYAAVAAARWVRDEFLTHNPRFGRRVYAYRITAISGHLSHDLIGAVFTERRNLGPEHTYLISFDGMRDTMATATRLPGGGRYRHNSDVDWDEETLVTMDEFTEYQARMAAKAKVDAS